VKLNTRNLNCVKTRDLRVGTEAVSLVEEIDSQKMGGIKGERGIG